MANCCFFDLTALGKKEDLERLFRIMKYEDDEYYIYRVRDVEMYGLSEWKDDLYSMQLVGDVAWASELWVGDGSYGKKNEKSGKIYTSMTHLSEILDLAIEWYTEEEGCGFAEHIAVCRGKILEVDTVDLSCPSFEIGDKDNYRDGTKEEIIEYITETYKEELGDDFDEFIENVDEILTGSGYIYMRIGGYDPVIDEDALWNGESRHVEGTVYYIED